MSELAPRTTISGTRASESNASPQGRGRLLGVDRLERRRDLRIVVEHEPLAGLRPGAPGLREPLRGRHRGELRVAEPAQHFGPVGETARRRHLADVALDAHEPLGLDHRADVVEDHAGKRAGPCGAEQHRENSAPRGAEHDGPPDIERSEDGQYVRELQRERIVVRIGVVGGTPASARIDGEDQPRLGGVPAERQSKLMKVRAVAGEAGQADDREPPRSRRSVAAHMQAAGRPAR
jgi:hypothetical protein